MLTKEPLLIIFMKVIFVKLVDCIPLPQEAEPRRQGCPQTYTERWIVKAF
jgi:hypothetical protein